MEPILAAPHQLETVRHIVRTTIQAVYPNYYPQGAIEFFLSHHSDENISAAIARGEVYLFAEGGQFVATGSVEGNDLCRLFVLPEYQGRGYGSRIMDFLEGVAFKNHSEIRLDASLPALGLYLKRGYISTAYHRMPTERGHFLCYHEMKLTRPG